MCRIVFLIIIFCQGMSLSEANENSDKKFDLDELEKLINYKDYTDSIKMDLYEGYMKIRIISNVELNIIELIGLKLPNEIKNL